jgi:hypothetical protein
MMNKTRILPNATGGPTFTANATGQAVDISDLGEKDIIVWPTSGAMSASVQIQVSALGGPSAPGTADPSWVALGSAITTAGATHTLTRALWMRAVVSSYVSGAVEVAVVGDFAHEPGGRRVSG